MVRWRLKTFIVTVAILLIGTAALVYFHEPFLSLWRDVKLSTASNVAVLYGLLALGYAPVAVAILLFGFALSYAFSFHLKLAAGLFILVSLLLIAAGTAKYVSQAPFSLAGMAVMDKWTFHLVKANEFPEEKVGVSLCQCEISSIACQCHEFYSYSSPAVAADFSLVPDKGANEMQVWLNGKLLYVNASPPRCYTQRPVLADACLDQ